MAYTLWYKLIRIKTKIKYFKGWIPFWNKWRKLITKGVINHFIWYFCKGIIENLVCYIIIIFKIAELARCWFLFEPNTWHYFIILSLFPKKKNIILSSIINNLLSFFFFCWESTTYYLNICNLQLIPTRQTFPSSKLQMMAGPRRWDGAIPPSPHQKIPLKYDWI